VSLVKNGEKQSNTYYWIVKYLEGHDMYAINECLKTLAHNKILNHFYQFHLLGLNTNRNIIWKNMWMTLMRGV